MKNVFFALIVLFLISCKKDGTIINTSDCKLYRVVHHRYGDIDTTLFSYSGDNISYKATYSYSPIVSTIYYTKSGSQYLYKSYNNGVQKFDGVYLINSQGLLDSARFTNLTTLLSTSAKYYYNGDNYLMHAYSFYNTYANDVKYYINNGNYNYWIYNYYDLVTPSNSTRDSITFEYYLDKPKVIEIYVLESKVGKLEKNLVKRRLYYDLFNSNTLRRTYDYEYLTDANNFVTRQILTIKNQPGDILVSKDTTNYEYTCN